MIVGGGMSPETNLIRHDVQRPRPPQVAVMSTPPPCAEVENGRAGLDLEGEPGPGRMVRLPSLISC